ncbi:MAG: response regulator transcription factor [Chloroflexi bacterium]|nr:response regulator transcription factor [Chloroflexota bacterium]
MPSTESARLVILDPSAFYYHAMQSALASNFDGIIIHACNETTAQEAIDPHGRALILISPNWDPPEALRLCRALRQASPSTRIVIMSVAADQTLFQTDAAYSGAGACLAATADTKTIAVALRQVERGATLFAPDVLRAAHRLPKLTQRELELLRALAQEKTDREIADELYLSEHTVGAHLRNIFRKLEVHGRREAVRRARHRGWV